MPENVLTTCPYCGVGCGIEVTREAGGWRVRGDDAHPANLGRLCSKGAALGETLSLEGRLLYPEIGGEQVSWDKALDAVTEGFRRVLDEHGPQAIAFYVSGQLLTEDYYVANKLMKGFIGSANIDTNSRLCMSSAVAAHKRAFGSDSVPTCYEDLELADLVVFAGSNAAWAHPVLYQRVAATKRRRPQMKVAVIDPRRTATCDIADWHLALKPGSDAVLFAGLLSHLADVDRLDHAFIATHTEGFAAALDAARAAAPDLAAVAAACELDPGLLDKFAAAFAATEKTVTLWSQGLNQSSSGVDKGNAVINVHLATGRIGRPGMGPFSITGQPNAMGGREVGGLANQLAAHMDFAPQDVDRVRRFWKAPCIAEQPGLKAVELFQAVARGEVKALWIAATNPAFSLPEADAVRTALGGCELVVVSDCVRDTDTVREADVRLPALAWGEKSGTVTNSERCMSRVRAFLDAPGEARPDWWMFAEVARRLGFGGAFDYATEADVFREYAALTAFENDDARDLQLGSLGSLDDAGYAQLSPMQWPLQTDGRGQARLFSDGRFYHANGRARFVAVVPRPPARIPAASDALVLNTGRLRDQWHSMTRTAKTPRLTAHRPEPFVEVHPQDARRLRLAEGGLARLQSANGELLARVRVDAAQRTGSVFVPLHWSDAFARRARVNALIDASTDPISGQPEFKHAPVWVEAWLPRWHSFLLSRKRLTDLPGKYACEVRAKDHWRYELAGDEAPDDWGVWVHQTLRGPGEWLEYADPAGGRYRAARLRDGRLEVAAFVAGASALPERDWLGRMFAEDHIDDTARMSLLIGRPGKGMVDAGQTVCSCFNVGLNTIMAAISERGLQTPEAIGSALQAGTNCGSCVPELRRIIAETRVAG